MCLHPKPPNIRRIFARAGKLWVAAEVASVREWLDESDQLRQLLLVAHRHLGAGPTRDDEEEACADFLGWRLHRVIDSYDPTRERAACFWTFLRVCLRRFCWDRAQRRRREQQGRQPLDATLVPGPQRGADEEVSRLETSEILARAIEALPEPYRTVFRLRVVEDCSPQEVATRLDVPYATGATWFHRARQLLRAWLKKHHPNLFEVIRDEK
jgi:RNA polymerase sigma factor (sigma-70 family)